MLAGKGDPIGAFIALLAVPLAPISTLPAYFTVPGITILDHSIPAKRVPVYLTAFVAFIIPYQFFEWHLFAAAWQFVRLI